MGPTIQDGSAVSKSYGLSFPGPAYLNGVQLTPQVEVTLLGVTLNRQGITETKLFERLASASPLLSSVMRLLPKWTTTFRKRRTFVQTYVLSLVDYVLYLHPVSGAVSQAAHRLERPAAAFVFGVVIPQRQTPPALTLPRLLPLQMRRHVHLIKAIAKFIAAAVGDDATPRDTRNYAILTSYNTVRPFLASNPVSALASQLSSWYLGLVDSTTYDAWNGANAYVREMPNLRSRALIPALAAALSRSASHQSGPWYLNKVPARGDHLGALSHQINSLLLSLSLTEE